MLADTLHLLQFSVRANNKQETANECSIDGKDLYLKIPPDFHGVGFQELVGYSHHTKCIISFLEGRCQCCDAVALKVLQCHIFTFVYFCKYGSFTVFGFYHSKYYLSSA